MVPPVPGKSGVDVYGMLIEPDPVNQADIPKLKNVEVSPQKPDIYLSTIKGRVILKGDCFNVVSIQLIQGDVGEDLFCEGTLCVQGSVKSGVSIHAEGSVIIKGDVDNAEIAALGDVCVSGKFTGSGKGGIRTGGDARLGGVENQKVESEGDIILTGNVVNAKLISQKRIMMSNSAFVSGFACAIQRIECAELGNEKGTETHVMLGTNPDIQKVYEQITQDLKMHKKKSLQLGIKLRKIEEEKKRKKNLSDRQIKEMEQLMEEKITGDYNIENLLEKRQKLEKTGNMYADPELIVSGIIHTSVCLQFHNRKRKIKGNIRCRRFFVNKLDILDREFAQV